MYIDAVEGETTLLEVGLWGEGKGYICCGTGDKETVICFLSDKVWKS